VADYVRGLAKVEQAVVLVVVGIDMIVVAKKPVNAVMLNKEVVIVLVWVKSMLLD
jgi:hypothetical protein